jgi:PIN domain nuclease of toxin-antitoxin system
VKLLLDTHAFLWWIGDDARLSGPAREAIADPGNDVSFSVASAWELAIKTAVGRFEAEGELGPFLEEQVQRNAFRVLPVKLEHAVSVSSLPAHHRDPFDRLLVAQAAVESMTLVSRDPQLRKYDVPTLW